MDIKIDLSLSQADLRDLISDFKKLVEQVLLADRVTTEDLKLLSAMERRAAALAEKLSVLDNATN